MRKKNIFLAKSNLGEHQVTKTKTKPEIQKTPLFWAFFSSAIFSLRCFFLFLQLIGLSAFESGIELSCCRQIQMFFFSKLRIKSLYFQSKWKRQIIHWPPEVPFFWALVAKVTVFGPQKVALLVAKSKFWDHFYSSNISQISPYGLLFHEIITFRSDFGQISILSIFGPILGIFPL